MAVIGGRVGSSEPCPARARLAVAASFLSLVSHAFIARYVLDSDKDSFLMQRQPVLDQSLRLCCC